MKKLILLFLLTTYISFSQTVNYTTDSSIFANPERGMYYHTETNSSGYSLLNQTSLVNNRVNNNITLILRVFYLEGFRNSAISTTYLNNIQTDLNTCRNARIKMIVRFAYNDGGFSGDDDAPKAIILNHINQLSSILNVNQDVIACVQMGFIGRWGEGYYTNYFGSNGVLTTQNITDRNEILQSICNNFPRQIQVRTPLFKTRLVGTVANTNSKIGHHNDSFLSSNSEQGTYNNVTVERLYVQQESDYVPVGGECNEFPTSYTNCSTAITDMGKYSWAYLNSVGYASGLISSWQTNGCLDEIKKRLGYRFELVSSTLSGNSLNLKINNTGFGHVINPRPIKLVLKNTSTNAETFFDLPTDCKLWLKNSLINIDYPITGVADGNYKLYLFSPDFYNNFPEYSIRFANTGVWNASTGYNDLNQTISIVTTGCATTTWDGFSWSAGIPLPNRTAIINGAYDTSNDGSIDCCDLIVNSGASLLITSGEYCSVSGNITVDNFGSLLVKSGGSLIPISPTCVSTGIVNIERRTTTMKRYDYTYWSAPVSCSIGNSLLGTKWEENYTFTFNTSNFFDIETRYQNTFLSNLPDGQDDNDDAWTNVLPSDIMIKGKGYASMIKSLIPTGTYPRIETVNFIGQLNTGVITTPITLSANIAETNDDKNLIGNPFSAAINSNDFIDANITNISGTLFFWTHTNTLSTSYSGLEMFNFSVNDYARYTKLGGVAATFGGKVPTNGIGSCQGFFVEAENNANLVFPPSLMSPFYNNTTSVVFFRTQEINRVWLNISTTLGLFSQQLIGYRDDSSLAYDKGFDAKILIAKTPIKFYSIENGDKYDIQARGTYDINDVVKLGYETAVAETFTISIDSLDNIDNVYIKDNGVLHNLPYTFTSEIGEFNDRFKLVYTNLLSTDIPASNSEIVVYPNPTNNNLYIKNFKGKILKVYDILGKTYKIEYTNYNENTIIVNTNILNKGLYLLRLDNKTIRFIKR
jgi:hypothetical protein